MTTPFEVQFTIPGVPVAKGRPRFSTANASGGHVRAYTPKKTRMYEQEVAGLAKAVLGLFAPANTAIQMTLVCFVPIPKSWSKEKQQRARDGLIYPTGKPDLDNFEKAVTDGCNGIVFGDDSQICDVVKSKRYSDNPRVHVRFFALGGFEHASHNLAPKKKGKRS